MTIVEAEVVDYNSSTIVSTSSLRNSKNCTGMYSSSAACTRVACVDFDVATPV